MSLDGVVQLRWPLARFEPVEHLWTQLEAGGIFALFTPQYRNPADILPAAKVPAQWRTMLMGEKAIPDTGLTTSERPPLSAAILSEAFEQYRAAGNRNIIFFLEGNTRLHVRRHGANQRLNVLSQIKPEDDARHVPSMTISIHFTLGDAPLAQVMLVPLCDGWFVREDSLGGGFPASCVRANWRALLDGLRDLSAKDALVAIELDLKLKLREQLVELGLGAKIERLL